MTQTTMAVPAEIKVSDVRYVPELYPRLKPLDDVVERYRDAIDNLPPIAVARDGVLVDGYHRWQAHVREGRDTIAAENLGDLADAEIVRESIRRNATHGQQFTRSEKRRLAGMLWTRFSDFSAPERVKEIRDLLAVSERSVQEWTKDARADEKRVQQEKAWDLWLDCHNAIDIAVALGFVDSDAPTDEKDNKARNVRDWIGEKRESAEFSDPPGQTTKDPAKPGFWGHVQHFDIWQFQSADKDAGQQSYFGALPPQVIENLLWFWTEPGEVVVDPFSGSGTTIEVAKAMGRRVWASDIRGNHYSPHLPIHTHDASAGWPGDAPRKADLVILDPPYWQQAAGRYSDEPGEMAQMDLATFYQTWASVAKVAMEHASRVAYIISPTNLDDGRVIDHATDMLVPFAENGWRVERRIIVPYQTQQATGQQVEWARENKRLLKLYRDLVVMTG